jgi:hypothetical protein
MGRSYSSVHLLLMPVWQTRKEGGCCAVVVSSGFDRAQVRPVDKSRNHGKALLCEVPAVAVSSRAINEKERSLRDPAATHFWTDGPGRRGCDVVWSSGLSRTLFKPVDMTGDRRDIERVASLLPVASSWNVDHEE